MENNSQSIGKLSMLVHILILDVQNVPVYIKVEAPFNSNNSPCAHVSS